MLNRVVPTWLFLSICSVLVSAGSAAEPKPTGEGYAGALRFVKEHLIGKTLETTLRAKIADTRQLETVFQRRTLYTHLVRNGDTASFDAIILIKQKLWDLDAKGKRKSEQPRVKDRALVIRYEIYASKASGAAIGSARQLTNSLSHTTGKATAVQMFVKNGALVLIESTPLYFDAFAQGDTYRASASITRVTFRVADGKLSAVAVEKGFDVNPKTLKRTPNEHNVTLESKQIPSLY